MDVADMMYQGLWPPFVLAGGLTSANAVQIGLLAGGFAVLMVLWLRTRRTQTRPTRKSSQPGSNDSIGPSLRDLDRAMTQLDQLSRQVHGKLDLKLATLQKLIRDAEERIARLADLQRPRQVPPAIDIELESETPFAGDADQADPNDAIYRLADSGKSAIQIARELSRHTGEVELILSLRRARNSAPVVKQAG